MWVWRPETSLEAVSSPQKTVMVDPLTGRVICWSPEVVVQVVMKAFSRAASDGGAAPVTVTVTVRSLLPLSNTPKPAAVTVAV